MLHSPPDLPGAPMTDSPIDRALTLLLANEAEAALRWSAAVVERDASIPSALVITCRLLEQMGRTEAAIDGFHLAVRRAIDAGNLPLAVASSSQYRLIDTALAHFGLRRHFLLVHSAEEERWGKPHPIGNRSTCCGGVRCA